MGGSAGGMTCFYLLEHYSDKILAFGNCWGCPRQTRLNKLPPLDQFCEENGIEHKLIKPRTPRHNGKVERSHRNDNERFYKNLKFYSFADLQKQMKAYLRRSNNIPISTLKSRDGKRKWLTPIEKRKELMYLDFGVLE